MVIVVPYDPIKLARTMEEQISRRNNNIVERRYWRFRSSRHYGGNNAGDVVGCNLRCAFCWAWKYAFRGDVGSFYTPIEAARRIAAAGPYRLARLTGGEPTLAWEHTREVIIILLRNGFRFVLETNGILIGAGIVEANSIPLGAYVRVSLKAPDPETFEKVTGAYGDGINLQLKALEALLEAGRAPGRDFHASLVLGLTPPERYEWILRRLEGIDMRLIELLEPEYIVLYPHVKSLLAKRRFKPYYTIEPEKRGASV